MIFSAFTSILFPVFISIGKCPWIDADNHPLPVHTSHPTNISSFKIFLYILSIGYTSICLIIFFSTPRKQAYKFFR